MTRSQERHDENEKEVARQIEAAKRLRLLAQLIGEDSLGRLHRVADLLTTNSYEHIPPEFEFRLVLVVDLILDDRPREGDPVARVNARQDDEEVI